MAERPLRIAVMVDRFPVVSETFVLGHVTALLDLGHSVDVYTRWRPEPGEPVHADVDAYGLRARTTYVDELLPPESGCWELPAYPADGQTWLPGAAAPLANHDRLAAAERVVARCRARAAAATGEVLDLDSYGYQAASLSALYRLDVLAALDRRYDVVHAHFGPAANTFRFARLLWNAPLVATFHGYDVGPFLAEQGPGVYRALFGAVSAVTVNSRATAARVTAAGCPPELVHLLPVGVDLACVPDRVPGGPGLLRVLCVARLVPWKGLHHLISALRLCAGPMVLDVVGDGPMRAELEALAEATAPPGSVRFHGAADAATVRVFLARCDVLALPSIEVDGNAEAQGLVLQEAQAAGVPVVATRVGGVPEGVLDGLSGLLVPPGDPAALATAIDVLAADPDLRRRMGRAGRRLVEQRFDQRVLIDRLVGIYQAARAGLAAEVPA